jgi:hypothetical protein
MQRYSTDTAVDAVVDAAVDAAADAASAAADGALAAEGMPPGVSMVSSWRWWESSAQALQRSRRGRGGVVR